MQKIGSGSFGSIYLAREKSSGKDRVCKVVNAGTPQAYAVASREVELLSKLDHPCIVSMFEYSAEPERGHLRIILEHITGGSAYDLLNRATRPLTDITVGRLVHQLLIALRYCHSHWVIHRDVKPENLMLVQRLDRFGGFDCKLIDFGCASKMYDDRGVRASCRMQDEQGTQVGTPAYMSPEVVRKAPWGVQSDIWSVGVSAVQLLTRELMFGGAGSEIERERVFEAICRYTGMGEMQEFLDRCAWWQGRSSKVLQFLTSLVKVDPCQRPTAEEALASDWMLDVAPAPSGITKELAHSLVEYMAAPEIVRCCLLSIVARDAAHFPEELQQFRSAFLAMDGDGDGLVTREDLQEALGGIFGIQFSNLLGLMPELDVESFFAAADLDQSGSLSFSEFVAACLYSHYGSLDALAAEAFWALDQDGDSCVHVKDISHLFRESDLAWLSKLPQSRPFCLEEWCSCIRGLQGKSRVRCKKKAPEDIIKCQASFLEEFFTQNLFACRDRASEDGDYEIVTAF